MCVNRVLRRLGLRGKLRGIREYESRPKLRNAELRNLYSSTYVTRAMKSETAGWESHLART